MEHKTVKQLKLNHLYQNSKIVTLNNTIENMVLNSSNTVNEKKNKGVV